MDTTTQIAVILVALAFATGCSGNAGTFGNAVNGAPDDAGRDSSADVTPDARSMPESGAADAGGEAMGPVDGGATEDAPANAGDGGCAWTYGGGDGSTLGTGCWPAQWYEGTATFYCAANGSPSFAELSGCDTTHEWACDPDAGADAGYCPIFQCAFSYGCTMLSRGAFACIAASLNGMPASAGEEFAAYAQQYNLQCATGWQSEAVMPSPYALEPITAFYCGAGCRP